MKHFVLGFTRLTLSWDNYLHLFLYPGIKELKFPFLNAGNRGIYSHRLDWNLKQSKRVETSAITKKKQFSVAKFSHERQKFNRIPIPDMKQKWWQFYLIILFSFANKKFGSTSSHQLQCTQGIKLPSSESREYPPAAICHKQGCLLFHFLPFNQKKSSCCLLYLSSMRKRG